MKLRQAWAAAVLAAACAGAAAQGVALAGQMGQRALLVIDGQPHTLAAGASARGVRFLQWQGEL
ncbi:MAG: TIGR02281 family clan AA aspartic protease, partial [Rubrivivax sp.]|nr:TIGR02281 family clan AA aspartic protease [Rubrivivax sp.]